MIDLRPDDQISPQDTEAFPATDRACQEVGWVFRGPQARAWCSRQTSDGWRATGVG